MKNGGLGMAANQAMVLVFTIVLSAYLIPVVSAGPEVCNYVDDDGDGLCFGGSNNGNVCYNSGNCPGGSCIRVDEDFDYNGINVGNTCDGIGECGIGTVYCVDQSAADCSTNSGRPEYDGSPESCNGLDDDCDAVTDEDFNYDDPIQGLLQLDAVCVGVGECFIDTGYVKCRNASMADCTSNIETYPEYGGSPEQCNGLDDDCDRASDENGDALCDNGQWCDGSEYCGGLSGCQAGAAVDCSSNDIALIASCLWNPDGVDWTWDFFPRFVSVCNEDEDECTTGIVELTHTCNMTCGAECDATNDCADSSCEADYVDYCASKKLVEYDDDKVLDSTKVTNSTPNECLESCACTDNPVTCEAPATNTYCVKGVCEAACAVAADCADTCAGDVFYGNGGCSEGCECTYDTVTDCNGLDGWYDTGAMQWVETGQCTEKEQKEQENRDYGCGASGCEYSVTGTRWVDTGSTRNKAEGTDCDDGLYCTSGDQCSIGVCAGSARDCSGMGDQCNSGVCDEGSDRCEKEPANEGLACNDGLFCNAGETCHSGLCSGGSANQCSDTVGCTVDSCDEAGDKCVNAANNALCDDSLWCNGAEACDAGSGCIDGADVDCSLNNLLGIATCENTPDSNPFTWDFFPGFTSACNEVNDVCTTGTVELTHTCNKTVCGAECDALNACPDTGCDHLDGCHNGRVYDCNNVTNGCLESCGCESNSCPEYTACAQTGNDPDADGIDTECGDNCPDVYNPDQADSNVNGVGDACESRLFTIQLKKGWNLISFNLEPVDTSIETVLEDIMDKVVIVNTFDEEGAKTYVPGMPQFSDLTEMDHLHGYEIKVKKDVTLTINGTIPDDRVIALGKGWNLISYLCESKKNVEYVFNSQLMSDLVIIKTSVDGKSKIYVPSMRTNTLKEMEPGIGYWVMMKGYAELDYDAVC